MLPHPDYKGRVFLRGEHDQIEPWMIAQGRDDLICYWDERNRWYRVTTQANFQSHEYWHGEPPELDSLETIITT